MPGEASKRLVEIVAQTAAAREGRDVSAAVAELVCGLLSESSVLYSPVIVEAATDALVATDWDEERRVLSLVSVDIARTFDHHSGELRVENLIAGLQAEGTMQPDGLGPVDEAMSLIRSHRGHAERLRFILISTTEGRLNFADVSVGGTTGSIEHFDARRIIDLYDEAASDSHGTEMLPDLHIPSGLEVLGPFATDGQYSTYFTVLPGELLADLYEREGERLLEHNVRSFLQARGRVNKGIQDTISQHPERFLTFNNGLSITASDVTIERSSGSPRIVRVSNLQIVNGGQTTASLYHASKRRGLPVNGISVAAKITVVEPGVREELAPLIAQFANAQNPVRMGDFTSNNPFHVAMDRLAGEVRAPEGGRWYYERARGRYAVALQSAVDEGRAVPFKLAYPPSRKLTKFDIAKFEVAWSGHPYVTALGAEKCSAWFTRWREDQQVALPDADYYRRSVAKALLSKAIERVLNTRDLGAYKSVVVAYTLALVGRYSDGNQELDAIWLRQGVDDVTQGSLERLVPTVRQRIISTSEGRNVTEWAKSSACWDQILSLGWARG